MTVTKISNPVTLCSRCGATDVYWMTCLPRMEAIHIAFRNGNPKALKLAKPRLFNCSGGEHVCVPDIAGFEAIPE